MTMIFAIDNGNEINVSADNINFIRNILVEQWMEYLIDYKIEKNISQTNRTNLGHYGEWFTPDILDQDFAWEKI